MEKKHKTILLCFASIFFLQFLLTFQLFEYTKEIDFELQYKAHQQGGIIWENGTIKEIQPEDIRIGKEVIILDILILVMLINTVFYLLKYYREHE